MGRGAVPLLVLSKLLKAGVVMSFDSLTRDGSVHVHVHVHVHVCNRRPMRIHTESNPTRPPFLLAATKHSLEGGF